MSFFELKAEKEITAPWAPFLWGLPRFSSLQTFFMSSCWVVGWWSPSPSSSLAEGQLLHEMRRWVKPLPPLASGSSQHQVGTYEKNMFILKDLKYLFNIITSYSRNASIHLPHGDKSDWKRGVPSLKILCAVSRIQMCHTGIGKSNHVNGLLLSSGVSRLLFLNLCWSRDD